MGRIVAIDYGLKRVGIAVTDPLQIIATPLTTVPTTNILPFLQRYVAQESVEAFVMGFPRRLDNRPAALSLAITKLIDKIQKAFPTQSIFHQDERYTSKLALAGMIEAGLKKKDRRNKKNLDKLSATIILQSFLANYNRDSG